MPGQWKRRRDFIPSSEIGGPQSWVLKSTHFVILEPRALCLFTQQIFTECFLSRPLEGVVLRIFNNQNGTGNEQSEQETDQSEWTLPVNDQHIVICTGEISVLEPMIQQGEHDILVALAGGVQWGSPDEMLLS